MTNAVGRSLLVRLPLLAMAVLAVTLAAVSFIVYEVLLLNGRRDLEGTLRRELARVGSAVSRELVGGPGGAGRADVRRAAETFLARAPGTDAYLTLVRIDHEVLRAGSGPAAIDRLVADGALPASQPGSLTTLSTTEGEILSLVAPVEVNGQAVASLQVAAPLDPVRQDARRALGRLTVASAVSLVVGGGLLALILRRALLPLRSLAATARTTELTDLTVRVPEPPRVDEVGVLAREFNLMLDRIERADEAREQFLASVSHELRTPITIARGHTEVLAASATASPERVHRASTVILEELARMSRLVDDLMALARSESNDFVIPGPVDLRGFFDDLRIRLGGLGVPDVHIGETPAVTVSADSDRLAQAVLNLVVNAATHTPAGTRIEVTAEASNRGVELVVHDNGPGVDPAILEQAFEPFVKGERGGSDATGLGLAVVAAIAAAHRGDVTMESSPAGTTVTLRLPPRTEPRQRANP